MPKHTSIFLAALLAVALAPSCSDDGGGGELDASTDTDTDSDADTDTDTDTGDTESDTIPGDAGPFTCEFECASLVWCDNNGGVVHEDQTCAGEQVCCEVADGGK